MKRSWMLAFFLGVMGFAFAHPHDDQPKSMLYYSDDCDIKITPNAGPRIDRDWNVFLTADCIYWTVRQGGTFYAISDGKVHDLHCKWEPGFKVGLGFNLPHDGWDLFAEYTWVRNSISDSKTNNAATSTLTPYWNVTGFTGGTLTRAQANWDVHYNNVTLDLGRNAYLSQYMKLRLFAGLQGAWNNQVYSVRYDLATPESGKVKLSQDFCAIGLRAGLNNTFQFTKNWSFFADLYLALLWGEFDLALKDSVINPTTAINGPLKTRVSSWVEEPLADIAAGFRYDAWFCNDTFHLLLQLGWEHQLWILHNELIKAGELGHGGDLLLQGLTFKVRFDF